jgi:ABC-type transport system substrate-binding protein
MKKLKKYLKKLKLIFNKKNFKWLKYLPKTLNKRDRYILSGLIIILSISGTMVWYKHWIRVTHEVATFGGTLTEGIVGEPKDLEQHTGRLVNAGLTRVNEKGEIVGDIAESWQILDDGKTYQFKIRNNFSSYDLLSQIENKSIWSTIDITTPDDKTLVFKFKQPFSPFLYTSTEPIFSYGPYKITFESKEKVNLEASANYWQGKPYITKIQINLYSDYNSLINAAKNKEIMGYLQENSGDYQETNSTIYQMTIPRELNLFFNLSKPALQDVNIRKNLRDGKALSQPLSLTLATSDTTKNEQEAQKIKDTWKNLNVDVTIKDYDNVTLQKDIIPNRNYDILLYGQDYGPDPDPYPFWHSSQIGTTGMNLSNFSNKNADKLLEEARQTFDAGTRTQKYKDFQAILTDQVPNINIKKEILYYVLSNDIKGVNIIYGSSEADRFLDINKWFINTKRVRN